MRIFKQLQKGGRLASRQPAALQRGNSRALALDVPLRLQDVAFRHSNVVSQCHRLKTVRRANGFHFGSRHSATQIHASMRHRLQLPPLLVQRPGLD